MEITITGQAPSYVSWDASRTMPYADAAFNETLRMAPPVGNDFRIANESDVMPSGGFVAAAASVQGRWMPRFLACSTAMPPSSRASWTVCANTDADSHLPPLETNRRPQGVCGSSRVAAQHLHRARPFVVERAR